MAKQKKQPELATVEVNIPPVVAQTEPGLFEKNSLLLLILAGATFVVYYASLSNGFMVFDDDRAIRYNDLIKHPTLKGLFGSQNLGMYAPVTWLGYTLVYQLFGENASAFHAFSLLLHIGCVAALFTLLNLIQPRKEVSFFTALLFALHPMQVEATSWIAGQSTLSFSLFYLLSIIAYVTWQDNKKGVWYGMALFAFLCSALAKSAAVTLPIMLLAFDWYKNGKVTLQNVLNKAPFLIISLVLGLYTLSTREAEGHNLVVTSSAYSTLDRFLMVVNTLLFYPWKLLAPVQLSVFYPFNKIDGQWSPEYYISPFILAGLVWFLWKNTAKAKEIGLASLWYFLPLTIMLPYVSVGTFEMRSDRYIYISSAGFFFLLVWLAQKAPVLIRRGVLTAAAAVLGFLTFEHTKVWKDEVACFQNCVDLYPDAPLCNCNLAYGELLNNKYEDCVKHYTQTLKIDSTYVESYNGRGQAYFMLKKFPEALADFDKAINSGIVTPKLYLNRGKCLVILNRPTEAMPDLVKSIELEPKNPETWYYKASAESKNGDVDNALKDYSSAIALNPAYIEALVNRGAIYASRKQYEEAVTNYSKALEYKLIPMAASMALNNRALAYIELGQTEKALADVNNSIAQVSTNKKAYEIRSKIYMSMGQTAKAQEDLAKLSQ